MHRTASQRDPRFATAHLAPAQGAAACKSCCSSSCILAAGHTECCVAMQHQPECDSAWSMKQPLRHLHIPVTCAAGRLQLICNACGTNVACRRCNRADCVHRAHKGTPDSALTAHHFAGAFCDQCPTGLPILAAGLAAEGTREHCAEALTALASSLAVEPSSDHSISLLQHVSSMAQAASQNSGKQDSAAETVSSCCEVASVAITNCETLLMAPQLLQLLHAVLHAVRHAHMPSSYKAAEGLTDLLTVLHDFGADEKPHELGAPLATSALVALLPLAQYPQAFASWEDSSLDEDAFMRFRCQELSAVAEIALDEAGLQCATSMSSDAIPFQPR